MNIVYNCSFINAAADAIYYMDMSNLGGQEAEGEKK